MRVENQRTLSTNDSPELLNIHNAFHQGQYQSVIDFDTSSLSSENKIPARVLQLRAQIAAGQAEEVLASIGKEGNAPDFAAVKAFAQYALGSTSGAVSEIENLIEADSENTTVQLLGGTVLQAAGKTEEALSLLSKHQGSLEAYEIPPFPYHFDTCPEVDTDLLYRIALIVHIHLQQNRTDLALKEVQAARKWAQDSLLVNIAESWVGLRMVCHYQIILVLFWKTEADLSLYLQGGERYQQAFYVFEEMAQAPSTSATKSLVSQAIAELHLGRLPEAEAALQQAVEKDPNDVEAIANSNVLNVILGKDTSEHASKLEGIVPEYPLLVDLQEKNSLFDQAAGKYSAKVAS